MLGVAHMLESQWAALSHPGTDAAGNDRLSTEDRSKASLPILRVCMLNIMTLGMLL